MLVTNMGPDREIKGRRFQTLASGGSSDATRMDRTCMLRDCLPFPARTTRKELAHALRE
jgi:hypothetical protein